MKFVGCLSLVYCCKSDMIMLGFLYRYRKAQLALQKGEEDLAREALKRRKSYAVSANVYTNNLLYSLIIISDVFIWKFLSVSFLKVSLSYLILFFPSFFLFFFYFIHYIPKSK